MTTPKPANDHQGNRIDPAAMYQLLDGASVMVPYNWAAPGGTRLRGSHPIVQQNGHLWVVEGLDDAKLAELRSAWRYGAATTTEDTAAARILGRIPEGEAVVAKSGFRYNLGHAAMFIEKGDRLSPSHPAVVAEPGRFQAEA